MKLEKFYTILGVFILVFGLLLESSAFCTPLSTKTQNTLKVDIRINWETQDSLESHYSIEKVTRLANTPYYLKTETESFGDWKVEFGNFKHEFNLSLPPRVQTQIFSLYVPDLGETIPFSIWHREKDSKDFIQAHIQTLKITEEKNETPFSHTEIFRGQKSHFNILLMGEGFSVDEKESYHESIETLAQGFLTHPLIEPYKESFSIFRSEIFAPQSGIPNFGDENHTIFNSFQLMSMIWSYDQPHILEVAGTQIDAIIIVVNSEVASGLAYYGNYAVVSRSIPSSNFLIHELSHLVLGVCDEYEEKHSSFKLHTSSFSPNACSVGKNKECMMNDPKKFSTYCKPCKNTFQHWIQGL